MTSSASAGLQSAEPTRALSSTIRKLRARSLEMRLQNIYNEEKLCSHTKASIKNQETSLQTLRIERLDEESELKSSQWGTPCDCGKYWINTSTGGWRRRSFSHASCGDLDICSPIGSSSSFRTAHMTRRLQPLNSDIEDSVIEPETDVFGLVDAAPKVIVVNSDIGLPNHSGTKVESGVIVNKNHEPVKVQENEEIQEEYSDEAAWQVEAGRCQRCLSRACITVKPTVGYYTMESVSKHCTPDDCWIVAHGNVYDVTRYLQHHPGGVNSILSRAGGSIDCSVDFDYHSKFSQRKVWTQFKIGRLAVCNKPISARAYAKRKKLLEEGVSVDDPAAQGESCCIQ